MAIFYFQKEGFYLEVKINHEIREYTESVFFGLSLRQFIFSAMACAVAAVLYLVLRPYLGLETLSWVCVLGASPFALLGFVRYHGMNAEQLLWAWLRTEIIEPKRFIFESKNIYYEAVKPKLEKQEKEARKRHA